MIEPLYEEKRRPDGRPGTVARDARAVLNGVTHVIARSHPARGVGDPAGDGGRRLGLVEPLKAWLRLRHDAARLGLTSRWLPSRFITHRHRPRAELHPAHELQVDTPR
jgi:hypothetical protein